MTKERATKLIWEYMHLQHTLKPADLIFILGSIDPQVAMHATSLYKKGYAPYVAISGDGTKHETELLNRDGQQSEAEMLKDICIAEGVPEDKIITEDKANNTGQNFEFVTPILQERGLFPGTCIVVQKPYMERRAYATGKVWWPDVEIILSSEPGTFAEYVHDRFDPDTIINIMIGDLERIKEYPAKGFQIEQEIPNDVWGAFEYLVSLGYDKHLIKK